MTLTITESVEEALKDRKTDPDVKNCLERVALGYTGRQQLPFATNTYCCRPKQYCPLQTEGILSEVTKLPSCNYIDYLVEMVERNGR